MSILASIGVWLLKTLLGGILGRIEATAVEAANRQRDAALLKAKTVEEGTALEVSMLKKEREIEAVFNTEAMVRPADDPFGVNKWNTEVKP